MKVNIKNVGGEITKDNETYTLQDNNFLNNLTLSSTFLKPISQHEDTLMMI